MKRIISVIMCIFVLASMFTVMASAEAAAVEPGSQVAKAIYGTPTIDGYAESIWDEAQINYIDKEFYNDGITTPNTVRFRAMYDENYLYLLAEVADETMGGLDWDAMYTGGNLWRRDTVGFVFIPDYCRDETVTMVAPSFWFYLSAYGQTANWMNVDEKVFITEDAGATKMFAITYATDYTTNVDYGYTIELKVNLKVRYEGIQMDAGTKIGFDAYTNNNNSLLMSSERNYGATWTGDINSYKNTAHCGTLEFCAKDVKFQNSEADLAWNPVPVAEETTTDAPDTTTAAPEADTTTAEPVDTTTEAPADTTTEAPAADTTTAAPTTNAPTTDAPAASGGCGGFVAASVIVVAVAALGGAMILNKKEN